MSANPRPAPGAPAVASDAALDAALPSLALAPEWKLQQRLWGHSFHPMCSYLASFPAGLAHAFIARYSRPGDVVLDPFSGRGTVPLQACAEGRVGVGNDLNPLAYLLTAAKVDPPDGDALTGRLSDLRARWSAEQAAWTELAAAAAASPGADGVAVPGAGGAGPATPLPFEVAVCFHPHTLAQVLLLRSALDLNDRADRFLAATVAGILHGKSASYLSALMPNTFSMPPRYVRSYAQRTSFAAERREVFDAIQVKLRRLFRQPLPAMRGVALFGDARETSRRTRAALRARALPERARLVVTSPPYLRVVRYGSYNWLRLWFLGVDAAAVDAALDDTHRLGAYLPFVREVLADLRSSLTDDAVVALVIGDVELDRGRRIREGLGLAATVWEACAEPAGYRLAGIVPDEIAAQRKMTKIWGAEAGRATRTDRLLVLAPTELGRRRAIACGRLPVDWTWPPRHGLRIV